MRSLLWLLSPEGSPPERPATARDVALAGWWIGRLWQALPTTLPRFAEWAGPAFEGTPWQRCLADRSEALRMTARLQIRAVSRIAEGLDRAAVPYVLLKGSALRFQLYDHPTHRLGGDLDFGVAAAALPEAVRVVSELGFHPAQWDSGANRFRQADPWLRTRVEAGHYELGFLVRSQSVVDMPEGVEAAVRRQLGSLSDRWYVAPDGRLACAVVVDLHHGISREIAMELLLRDARRLPTERGGYFVPAPYWTALHLIFKIYWEGVHTYRQGLYQYADLCRLVPRLTDDDVGVLWELLSEWGLEAAGHYVLRRLPTEFGVPLSGALTRLVDRAGWPPDGVAPLEVNDLGDMWPKLSGWR